MSSTDTLVSIGLPVYNGADRMEGVVRSVLEQDHENLELVISDNASTDHTEELCRELARRDSRVVYHRQRENIGATNNFIYVGDVARGAYLRWAGDDDRLEPSCISRSLRPFAEDERLILVTSQTAYTDAGGVTRTMPYTGTGLGSDDPVTRMAEMMRLHTQTYLLLDPLYGVIRRALLTRIPRRNMLREDEVLAIKLALAGPWSHVPEILSHRNVHHRRLSALVPHLEVPRWTARFATTLQYREVLQWLPEAGLGPRDLRRARAVVLSMYVRRQRGVVARRGRKALRLATGRR
ncbi:glycosyltransferase family 2 protein [Planobispora siamensis]|uniref:Glycosyltransferase 2-like domain-containing protein n=1 Tax=Planobispora siamensis TaxID=936338 RepID=A0A8J3SEA9_9ACTN|nr:glycosyltransferase [Planobispora siamensis]GIH91026.1 hypothetical protein Psi01_16560 [Planobispora siamensis]